MNLPLGKLMLFRLRGGIRQRLKEILTLRGSLFLTVSMVGLLAFLVLKPQVIDFPLSMLSLTNGSLRHYNLAQLMPYALFLAFLLTLCLSPDAGLCFSPAEIDLLYTAPISRTALVLYKLSAYSFGIFLSSLLAACIATLTPAKPIAIFLGTFFSLFFIQLLTLLTGLLSRLVIKGSLPFLKYSHLLYSAIILIAASSFFSSGLPQSLADFFNQFGSAAGGNVLLAPFRLFSQIYFADPGTHDLASLSMLGLLIIFGLIVVVIRLDCKTSEATTNASLTLHRRWQRRREGGTLWQSNIGDTAQSLAKAPHICGIGPLIWRQFLSALRGSRPTLIALIFLACIGGPLLVSANTYVSLQSLLGGIFVATVFIIPRSLPFDFRNDLKILTALKMLPIPTWKLCLGQIGCSVLLTTVFEVILTVSAGFCVDKQFEWIAFLGIPFLLPINLLIFTSENLFFILFPAPLVPIGRADFDFIGRTLAAYALTTFLLVSGIALATAVGLWALQFTGWNLSSIIAITWAALSIASILPFPLLIKAFQHLDAGHY